MPWNDRIRRRFKLRELDILLTVVDAGSMAKAATRLNMAQPAISKAVADLEHLLGVRLLDRSRRGVEPTAHGSALLKRGIAVFDELRQHFNERQIVELTVLVGTYNMHTRMCQALKIDPQAKHET